MAAKKKETKTKRAPARSTGAARTPTVMQALRARALAYPGAEEHFPWGERVVKVKEKVFVFLGRDEGPEASLSVKLPASFEAAVSLPGCEPTGYGLGKARWVTASFPRARPPPLALLSAWLDESYRAVAPRGLVKALEGEAHPAPASRRSARARRGVARR
jgi:predicted DNA-binding protein (MmcQ/YjbR family)